MLRFPTNFRGHFTLLGILIECIKLDLYSNYEPIIPNSAVKNNICTTKAPRTRRITKLKIEKKK